jgi:hypothetical protein
MKSFFKKNLALMGFLLVPLSVIVYRNFFYTRKGWHTADIQYHVFFWVVYILLTPLVVLFITKFWKELNQLPRLLLNYSGGYIIYNALFLGISFTLCRFFSDPFDGRIRNLFNSIRDESFLITLFVYLVSTLVLYVWIYFEKNKATTGKILQLEKLLHESELRLFNNKNDGKRIKNSDSLDKLVIKNGYKNIIVSLDDILCLLSSGQYIKVVTGIQTHLLSSSLSDLQSRLPGNFLRVHRSHIVNADFIKAARSLLNGDYILELKNGLELRASRTYRQQLMQVLKRA